jgi:hypothetical protein
MSLKALKWELKGAYGAGAVVWRAANDCRGKVDGAARCDGAGTRAQREGGAG